MYKAVQQQQLNVAAKPKSRQKGLIQGRHSSLGNSPHKGSLNRDLTFEGRMSSCMLDATQNNGQGDSLLSVSKHRESQEDLKLSIGGQAIQVIAFN
jgi:hypothetical protein